MAHVTTSVDKRELSESEIKEIRQEAEEGDDDA